MFEFHNKMDTAGGGDNDGICQMWVDGTRIINRNDVSFSEGNTTTQSVGWS